jgi:hypothetical protein
MMIPIPRGGIYHNASGIENALATAGIDDIAITAKPGQKLVPLPEGASYLGFIFAGGVAPADVEASLREAHSRLDFEIFPALEVIRSRSPDILLNQE